MAKIVTNRDRLDRLVDYFRKATRYWWLAGGIVVLGGILAVLFAQSRPRRFQSWSMVFYQERIQSSVLRGGSEGSIRNIGERYRELLMSQSLLQEIIDDPKLNPYPELLAKDGANVAVEVMRRSVGFQGRGSVFRISFIDDDPARAQAVVERLTALLNAKDDELRSAAAQETVKFALEEKEEAEKLLTERNNELNEFLAKHPEFVQDLGQPTEGASIRANQNRPTTSSNPRIASLERQRARILARLNAKAGGTSTVIEVAPSPERVAALAALADAERDLSAAKRELDAALTRYTDLHPTVVKARAQVTTLQGRVRQAQAAVPPAPVAAVPPASAEDRAALQRELKSLEDQIAAAQAAERGKTGAEPDSEVARVVELENLHFALRRAKTEQQSRVDTLTGELSRAQSLANQQIAEQGGRLSIVDPAFRPTKPHGAGKSIFVLAGIVVFGAIGGALALGLALIDDRLYRRDDLDDLGITVLAVVPPARALPKKTARARRAAAALQHKDASS
ncbi:MAG: hypothetical protein R3B48_11950 [Kofleriaceae bacterium]